MKFIFNFLFFGLLFYIIYLYFPDAFHTLVEWAQKAVTFLKGIFQSGMDAVNKKTTSQTTTTTTSASLFFIPAFFYLKSLIKR